MVAIYFTSDVAGVRMNTTSKVDALIGRLNRSSRRAAPSPIVAAVIVDKAGARKLRRVLDRRWSGQRRGSGVFGVSPTEVTQVAQFVADKFGITVYGVQRELSAGARNLVLARFARGKRGKWTPAAGHTDQAALDELLAAGIITRHRGDVYRGTERSAGIVRQMAKQRVPERGRPAPSERPVLITKAVVVPDPMMARELLLSRMDDAQHAGGDPLDVLHRDAYRGAVVNQRDRLGGYAMLRLDEFQQRGVAMFRQTGEEGQLGGAQAVDYEKAKVDSSLVNAVTEAGAMARAEHRSARDMLKAQRKGEDDDDLRPGLVRVAIAERLALYGHSIRQVSVALGMGSGGAARERVKAMAMDIATDLARHFGYLPGSRSELRAEIERGHDWSRPY